MLFFSQKSNSRKVCTSRSPFSYNPDFNYSDDKFIDIGKVDKVYVQCNAKKWAEKAAGFCYARGKVVLPVLEESLEMYIQ